MEIRVGLCRPSAIKKDCKGFQNLTQNSVFKVLMTRGSRQTEKKKNKCKFHEE